MDKLYLTSTCLTFLHVSPESVLFISFVYFRDKFIAFSLEDFYSLVNVC